MACHFLMRRTLLLHSETLIKLQGSDNEGTSESWSILEVIVMLSTGGISQLSYHKQNKHICHENITEVSRFKTLKLSCQFIVSIKVDKKGIMGTSISLVIIGFERVLRQRESGSHRHQFLVNVFDVYSPLPSS